MIQLVMRPTKEPVVKHEGVYSVDMNGIPLGLKIRARNAKAAEEKLSFVFDHELSGKTLNFNVEDFQDGEKGKEQEMCGQTAAGQDSPVEKEEHVPGVAPERGAGLQDQGGVREVGA